MRFSKRILCLMITIAGMNAGLTLAAEKISGWIKDDATVDGGATVYLSTTFGQRRGKFDAVPESVTDNSTTVEGTFLVGTYRIVSDNGSPNMQDAMGKPYDELIVTDLIGCDSGYAGTLRRVEKLDGKVVLDEPHSDSQVTMTQTHETTTDSKLCQLHQGKTRSTFNGLDNANPSYNPEPSATDIDKLIDKNRSKGTPTSGGSSM
jgi:hypothetical protein